MGSFPETYILKHPNNFVWTDVLEGGILSFHSETMELMILPLAEVFKV